MDPAPPDGDRLFDLACAYCDEQATLTEVAELEALIESDESARRSFLAYALVNSQLPLVAGPRAAAPPGGPSATRSWPSAGLARLGRTAAAIVLIAASIGAAALFASRREPVLATLTDMRFAKPLDSLPEFAVGQSIGRGRFAIAAGAAQLTLTNGVTLMLNGPTDLNLVNPLRVVLHAGSVVVRVPKGMSGFRLDTATAEVLDLGTEFAVRTRSGHITDVQVYEGAVIANGIGDGEPGFPFRIEAGEAQRFTAQSTADPQRIAFDDLRFLRSLPPEPATGQQFISAEEDERMFGRPRHDRISVLPAPRDMVIDGRLEEWPATPGFRSSFGNAPDAAEWVEGWMMYDDERLYVAARVGDPAPLRSTVSPDLDADKAWMGGGVQLRISTDRTTGWPVAGNSQGYYWLRNRPVLPTAAEKAAATNPQLSHLILWHHAPSGRACLSLAHGMLLDKTVGNPSGYEGCFAPFSNGRGYVLEYSIPWALLGAADDPPRAGDVLAAAWQVHFADDSGRIWRRQIIDVRNLAEPYRIGVWQRAATWGRAEYQ